MWPTYQLFTVNTITGNGNTSICNNGVTASMGMTMQASSDEQTTSAMTTMTSTMTSQYCPRHHHHTQQQQQQQQQQQRQTPSPNKRHRLTPRPHNIQRPCLDFEKMQQVHSNYKAFHSFRFTQGGSASKNCPYVSPGGTTRTSGKCPPGAFWEFI